MDLVGMLLHGPEGNARTSLSPLDAERAALGAARRVVGAFLVLCLGRIAVGRWIEVELPSATAELAQVTAQIFFMLGAGVLLWLILQRIVRELAHAQAGSLQAARDLTARLSHAAEFRDGVTGSHLNRIAYLTDSTCRAYGLAPERSTELGEAARLHDIGKIGVPDAVLLKPGRLDERERAIMEAHVEIGGRLLEGTGQAFFDLAHTIATTHHEWWNGCGYPNGLAGEAIPLEGRIVAVCDVYDALTSDRPYKEAWSHEDAMEEIRRLSGKQFDPKVVAAFEAAIRSGEGVPARDLAGTLAACD